MNQQVSSLNLPESNIREFQTQGYSYCNDVKSPTGLLWQEANKVPKCKTALEIYRDECTQEYISTFNKALDEALGGGIRVGCITEFCGEPGTGKTQLCLHLCVNVQIPLYNEELIGGAIYVNTSKAFPSHRLKEIARTVLNRTKNVSGCADINPDEILSKVHVIDVDDHIQLKALVKYLEYFLEEHLNIKLLIIDNITAPLKLLETAEKTIVIYEVLRKIQQLALKYKFAIVFTNILTTKVRKENVLYHTPSLGQSYSHRINTRVMLSKKTDSIFIANITKNILKPESKVEFTVS